MLPTLVLLPPMVLIALSLAQILQRSLLLEVVMVFITLTEVMVGAEEEAVLAQPLVVVLELPLKVRMVEVVPPSPAFLEQEVAEPV